MDLPKTGFAVFWLLFTSWNRQHSCANTLSIWIYIFYYLDAKCITGYKHCVSMDAESISGQITGYSGHT